MSEIRIDFLGGAGEIGASCAVAQVGDTTVVVDCGVRFKVGQALPDLDALTGRRVDAILVTHAHSDHTGALPVVHQAFPSAPIHLTPPTADLVAILQRDALRLMDSPDREGELPLYTERQVEAMREALVPVPHGGSVTIGDVEATWLPASHILGASMIHLATPYGHVLFTGDYSASAQRTVPALTRPTLPVDVLVTETTYGNRLHSDRAAAETRLVSRVRETLEGGGRVLVPAFAIGRAQEVLLILKQAASEGQIPDVPILVDGMVRQVCDVYARHEGYVTRSLARDIRASRHPFWGGSVRAVRHGERREALEAGPCVIVASSGMLSGGPSAFYAAAMAPCEKDAILITGYQDEESPGRALLRLAEQAGPRDLRVGDQVVPVRCRFETYSLSAHADRMQMLGLAEALRPRTVVLVHGDAEAKAGLAAGLSCRDVLAATEGTVVSRRYAVRRTAGPPRAPELDDASARALLAGAQGPVRLEQVAEAWLGRHADAASRERLAQQLEALGVARRDDERRSLLWPTEVDETDDPALEEALKAENPKGRLLELCMRLRTVPEAVAEPVGRRHAVRMTVAWADRRVESGRHVAGSRKLAEQLAARELLATLEGESAGAVEVSADDADRLRLANPKGRLLEMCAARRLPPPTFDVRAVPGGFVATVMLGGVVSRAWRAESAKGAEQAAAADLLACPQGWKPGEDRPAEHGTPAVVAPSADARGRLNELRQLGHIRDFGYEEVGRHGPPHQPVFVMRGWADLPDGRARTEPLEATSKKEGQRQAADLLLLLLERPRIDNGR